jgi:ComF family protein
MAALCIDALQDFSANVDVIVPVPLAGLRKRTRGYNQAELLAQGIGEALGLPVARRAVVRTRRTSPQAHAADAEERRRNVADAFRARPEDVLGQRILLVDDVCTTGATLDACSKALFTAGAAHVQALAFASDD